MKQDLNIDRVWNGREWMTRSEAREQARQMRQDYKEGRLRNGLYRFGRKAPTAAELRAQWLEQQRHEEEIRQRFTTADLADDCKPLGENEGRIGLFQEVKDMKKKPIIVSEYESNHKPIRLPC